MAQQQTQQSLLADLVDLKAQLELDHQRDSTELRQRDRAIGRELEGSGIGRLGQLRQWLQRTREPERPMHGAQAVVAYRLTALALVCAGLVLGVACAAAALYYDGTRPVNVVSVLVLFVGLQLLLLAMLGIVLLPRRLAGRVPGLCSLQQVLAVLSPGRLMPWLGRILPQEHRELLKQILGTGSRVSAVYGNMGKWGLLLGSQLFALGFNLGALGACLYLVVSSDLAFGWSTTLHTDPQGFHSLMLAIAVPWSHWFAEAVPSLELVAATRYFRIESGVLGDQSGAIDAATLGGWWPFLAAAIACYGLLPRLLTTITTAWRFHKAIEHAFIHMPGAAQVLDRMNNELIELSGSPGEPSSSATYTLAEPAESLRASSNEAWVVNWAGIQLDRTAIFAHLGRTWGIAVEQLLDAGGTRSLQHDASVIQRLAQAPETVQLMILTKAWEPPLMEFVDFLTALRQTLPAERPILVLPLALDECGGPVDPTATQIEIWRRKMRSIGDPWLDVGPNPKSLSNG